jgi:Cof subfamily protein (haloacid dehalogenase superfamily)
MNQYQIICSDIDGTLLNKDRELSEATISEVKRINELIPFILVSSRMPKSMRQLQSQLGNTKDPLIAYNGSLIIHNNEVLKSIELLHRSLLDINSYCNGTTIHLSLYHNDEWVVPAMDYWGKREAHNTKVDPTVMDFSDLANKWEREKKGCHKIMAMGEEEEIDGLYNALNQHHAEHLNFYRSKPTYIEISDKQQDKASSLKYLIESKYPTQSMANAVAFGDNYNDMSLLKEVGLGVAVANAKPEVLDVSNLVTKTNKEDGVAEVLRELF